MSRLAGELRTGNKIINIPVKAGEVIEAATMVAIDADGYAVTAIKAASLITAGTADEYADNKNGASGDVTVRVMRGAVVMKNDGSIKSTDILKNAYISDKKTVTITSTGSSVAGKILEADEDLVTVDIL